MAKPMKPAQQLAAVMDRQRYLAATVDECEYRSRFGSTEVGDAQAAVEAAQRAREQVAASGVDIWKWIGRPVPNLIAASRCEQLMRAAEALLMRGGETAPLLPESHVPPQAEAVQPAPQEEPTT
jgi:hypothetical protein